MACDIWAEAPILALSQPGVGVISGRGRRECTGTGVTTAKVTVRLRQDRSFWPDRNLASQTNTGTDVDATVRYECHGTGTQRVFTEVVVDLGRRWVFFRKTQKARSATISAALCG